MSRPLSSRLRGPLLSAAAAALVLTTTTALAGSGVGGAFNLGQVNTVDAQTSLTGNPGGMPLLKATTAGTAAAVRGVAVNGIGTNGISTSGVGQQGLSDSGIGTLGTHGNTTGISPGVQGETNSTDPNGAGVVGKNSGGGPGLKAIVNPGAPPLAVNSQVKVLNLNADKLDDLDSAALQKRVTGTCGAGSAIKTVNADGTVTCEPVGGGGVWSLSGNSGTTPGTNFLGTTDNTALELKANGQRALRIEPDATSPNLIGGFSGNAVTAGAHGATIGGGGESAFGANNRVIDDFGTVGGGKNNQAGDAITEPNSALPATVGGGESNTASASYSVVAGGVRNTASAYSSTVGGGRVNTRERRARSRLGWRQQHRERPWLRRARRWRQHRQRRLEPRGRPRCEGNARWLVRVGRFERARLPFPRRQWVLRPRDRWIQARDRHRRHHGRRDLVLRSRCGKRHVGLSQRQELEGALLPRRRRANAEEACTDPDRDLELQEPGGLDPAHRTDGAGLPGGVRPRNRQQDDRRGRRRRRRVSAIQGLYRQNQALSRQNQGLRRHLDALRTQLQAQDARLTKLEHAFAARSR